MSIAKCVKTDDVMIFPARRYASADTSYDPVSVSLSRKLDTQSVINWTVNGLTL